MSEATSPTPSRPGSPLSALPDATTPRPFRFNFEPRRAESVSGTTEGRGGDYFGATPRLELFNSSTSNLALGALPQEWSSSKHGFHAISTVLNNPHKRQAPPKAHSHLPPVPLADLPRVKRKDFDSYLRAVGSEWAQFERNNELGREGAAQLDGTSATSRPSTSRRPSQANSSRPIPDLETVPSVFFDPSFNLGNPRTFDLVTEQDQSDASDPSSLSRSLPLLEKFSHYADTVEQHLVKEISLRSTSFFAALTNLHDLQSESEQCLDRIAKLRGLLNKVDDKSAKRGLELVRKEIKVRSLEKAKEGVRFIGGVVEMTGIVKNLVTAGQWGEALDVLDEMERLWKTEPRVASDNPAVRPASRQANGRASPLPSMAEEAEESEATSPKAAPLPSIPLSSLSAFSSLPEHLQTLTVEITTSLSSELIEVLRVDLSSSIKNIAPSGGLSLNDRLYPILQGLIRTRGVKEAILLWREAALTEVTQTIKQHVPLYDDGEEAKLERALNGDSSSALESELKSISHPDFVSLLRDLYQNFLKGAQSLQTQSATVVDVLKSIGILDPRNISSAEDELRDIVTSFTEKSNTQSARLITKRSEIHSSLQLAEFYDFFNVSWDFVVKCEVLCQRMIVGLRGVVVSQAKSFLQTFHQSRISQSAKLVEDEQWSPAEISAASQHVADVLVNAAMRDPPELSLNPSGSSSTLVSPVNNQQTNPTSSPPSSISAQASKHLRIEERPYFSVSATNEVLTLLQDYLRIIVNLPTLTTDSISRVIEFLKAFNSRTCQVVLGAGAMRSAGLKNITAKHLALASQSLSIMIAMIPYVREAFRRHLNSKQAVMLIEFDKLKRDYQEHQNEIHQKLIAIMGDRLSSHVKSLKAVNWEQPKPGGGINNYMELLVKETVTLHKVLSRYLSTPVVEYVMTQVFAAINHRLSEEYSAIELPHQEAKMRLLADAKYLHQKLSALKNVSAQSAMLETVITEKTIRQAPATSPSPVAPPVRSNTLSSANARLKGLLSNNRDKSGTLPPAPSFPSEKAEKALPVPTPPIPITASPSPRPHSPIPLSTSPPPLNTNGEISIPAVRSESPLPALPAEAESSAATSGGFREVPDDPRPSVGLSAFPPKDEEQPSEQVAQAKEDRQTLSPTNGERVETPSSRPSSRQSMHS